MDTSRLWYFPGGYGLTPTGSNGAGIETFLDDIPLSVTREVLQNSIDAVQPGLNKPVHVKFSFETIEKRYVLGADELLHTILPKAKAFWEAKNNSDTLRYLKSVEEVLSKDSVPMLVISDYNTTGLNDINFKSLIEGDGYSEKADETSTGSKGIGKAAPFAASNLRMVFYNSKSTSNGNSFSGVMNFVSYEDKSCTNGDDINFSSDSYITQARGRLKYNGFQANRFNTNRTEYGTDLFIMGLKAIDNWKERIILAVLNNFLVALFQNKLEVTIGGIEINTDSLGGLLESIKTSESIGDYVLSKDDKRKFLSTYAYYLALSDERHIKVFLPEEFVNTYPFIERTDDAVLHLISTGENDTRRVLQTRKSGMTIYERNRISSIDFTGVFHATGVKLNTFLRRLENVNHDVWSTDREDDKDRKRSEQFLKDLLRWYKQQVEEHFGQGNQESIKAYGLSELIPMLGDGNNKEGEKEESGINFSIGGIKQKEQSKSSRGFATDGASEEKMLESILDSIGLGEGDTGGSGTNQKGAGGGSSTGNNHSAGTEDGNHGEYPDGESVVTKVFKEVPRADHLSMKLVFLDAENGKYRMIIYPKEGRTQIGVAFDSIGENGTPYNKTLTDVTSRSGHRVSLYEGKKILVDNVVKNQRIVVDFTISSQLKVKMKGTFYEVES